MLLLILHPCSRGARARYCPLRSPSSPTYLVAPTFTHSMPALHPLHARPSPIPTRLAHTPPHPESFANPTCRRQRQPPRRTRLHPPRLVNPPSLAHSLHLFFVPSMRLLLVDLVGSESPPRVGLSTRRERSTAPGRRWRQGLRS
ncbi:hypothetical protein CPC08DRAFT_767219 [Agrocybe pediades]|nr:hypothetical protein CPC08DRAFT_767219 [Agrocybe pediades]